MKKLIFPSILITIIAFEIYYIKDITLFVSKIINNHPDVIVTPKNEYAKDYGFEYIKQNETFIPYSYGDLMDIFYTILNNGWDDFTFYCPEEYEKCIKDLQTISNNDHTLTSINNYINPLNSFYIMHTSYDDSGEINIKVEHLYSEEKIKYINEEIDKIIAKTTNNEMSIESKIRAIHDYIITNTKYDVERNNTGSSQYESNTAYGLLKEHMALCSGYSDTMAIILSRLGLQNYKVASKEHVWNAVKINDKWYHLDLTWDDPVSNQEDILDHKYFLISTKDLEKLDNGIEDHVFDKTIYLEFKTN